MRFEDSDFDSDSDDDDSKNPHESFRKHMSPSQVDQSVRSALQMCWMMLPSKKKTPEDVEAQFRKLVDRAIRDMREDFDTFEF